MTLASLPSSTLGTASHKFQVGLLCAPPRGISHADLVSKGVDCLDEWVVGLMEKVLILGSLNCNSSNNNLDGLSTVHSRSSAVQT